MHERVRSEVMTVEIGTWLFRMRKPARDLKLVQKGLVTKA